MSTPIMHPDAGSSDESPLLVSQHGSEGHAIVTLTLNRPAQYNALSENLLHELQVELNRIANDDAVKVVVIEAKGRAFCTGHDLKQMRLNPAKKYYQDLFSQCGQMMQTIVSMQQPVIAKVQGMATAAGCQLVASCDLAIAAKDATFAVSGINLGLFCSTPAVALSRNVSRKRAFKMLMTGEFIDTGKAIDWGLINDAVEANNLDIAVQDLAETIVAKPVTAIYTGKKMFYEQLDKELQSAYDYAGETMACNMLDKDTIEGIDAFIEKRDPSWK